MTLDLIPSENLRAMRSLDFIAGLFKAVGLVWAYQNMMSLADEGMKNHPETIRVPAMRVLLMDYFAANYKKLIYPQGNSIFPTSVFLSSMESLRAWQNAGYPMRRTRGNYQRRLKRWKAIYDGTDLVVERTVHPVTGKPLKPLKPLKGGLFDDKQSKRRLNKIRYANLGKVKDKSGNVITYEYVISRRNDQYGATATTVPFWYVLNYGTRGGYPEVEGIHFVERAEKAVESYLGQALSLYERYAWSVLIGETTGVSFSNAAAWIRSNSGTQSIYLDTVDAAIEIAVANVF